jgi:hypothetical protein
VSLGSLFSLLPSVQISEFELEKLDLLTTSFGFLGI